MTRLVITDLEADVESLSISRDTANGSAAQDARAEEIPPSAPDEDSNDEQESSREQEALDKIQEELAKEDGRYIFVLFIWQR